MYVKLDPATGAVTEMLANAPVGINGFVEVSPDDPRLAAFWAGLNADHLAKYARDKASEILSVGATFDLGGGVSVLCDATPETLADLGHLARFGARTPDAARTWIDNVGKATVLTGANFVALDDKVSAWRSAFMPFLTAVVSEIGAGSIKSRDQIDRLPWPAA